MVQAHTNTSQNNSKKLQKTNKLWGLKQNKKAPYLWHEDERLWIGVYKVAKVLEVKIVNRRNTKGFVLCEREESLEIMNQENKEFLSFKF